MQRTTYHKHGTGRRSTLNPTVVCTKCKKVIGLGDAYLDEATGLGWFDPYAGTHEINGLKYPGSYVHFECLSQKRKDEISEQERLMKERDLKENL